jgi:metallo-beta-lactamase family protein
MQSIGFHGAAETVTGSRHLLNINGKKILVDCGMFQGERRLRDLNWEPFAVPPNEIDLVLITHAHMDHIGWLPRLVQQGYRGPIYATRATVELSRISLPDSGRLQEEEARHRNKHNLSRHKPALPLYTEEMAYQCLKQFEVKPYDTMIPLPGEATCRFMFAGHIMGSAFIEIYFPNGERILMSGDLGRFNTPIIKDPTIVEYAEYLTIESTYGDRLHEQEDPLIKLERILNDAFQNGTCVLVPSFAIGRTQELMYYISLLQSKGRIPRIPMFVDSPMATSVSQIYGKIHDEHDEETEIADKQKINLMEPEGLVYIRDRNMSMALNRQPGSMLVVSGSGMANGGRIIHHLLHRIESPNTLVLFTGYQAQGTLGRRLIEKQSTVRILGKELRVRAKIDKLNALSAHADQGEIIKWLSNFKQPPKKTFIVHGEPGPQAALQTKIKEVLGWDTAIPKRGQNFQL